MMLIKLRVEPAPITRLYRNNPQTIQPRITHPPQLPPAAHITSAHSQTRRSQPSHADFEEVLLNRAVCEVGRNDRRGHRGHRGSKNVSIVGSLAHQGGELQ